MFLSMDIRLDRKSQFLKGKLSYKLIIHKMCYYLQDLYSWNKSFFSIGVNFMEMVTFENDSHKKAITLIKCDGLNKSVNRNRFISL